MMSMSMYRSTKSSSTKAAEQVTVVVKRSHSVPLHLSEDSQDFMRTVVEQASSIPEGRELSQYQLADSIRSDKEDFFLPMDDSTETDEDDTHTTKHEPVHKGIELQQKQQQQKQQHRDAAFSKLEEFFLGESFGKESKPSPTSVMDASIRSHPKRNIFGQIMEQVPVVTLPTHTVRHRHTESGHDFFSEDEDVSSLGTKEMDDLRTFTKLKFCDRAYSLPLDFLTSTDGYSTILNKNDILPILPLITKKPSLKKISSIGTGMSHKTLSDGNLQRTVSFSNLSIREYPPAISDNPSCSFGPPVQLDWDYEAEATHTIDGYEESRQPRRASRDLLLSYYDRRFLLIKQAGYSRSEVKEAIKAAERVKRERMLTDLFLPAQAFDETMENIVETVKRFFSKSD